MASFGSYDISAVQEFVPTGGEAPPFAYQPEQPAMALPTQLLLTPPAEALLEGPDFLFAPCLDPFLPSSMGYYFGPSRRGASGALGLPRYYARVTSLGLPLPPVLVNLALPPDALQSVLANADAMLDEGYRAGAWTLRARAHARAWAWPPLLFSLSLSLSLQRQFPVQRHAHTRLPPLCRSPGQLSATLRTF